MTNDTNVESEEIIAARWSVRVYKGQFEKANAAWMALPISERHKSDNFSPRNAAMTVMHAAEAKLAALIRACDLTASDDYKTLVDLTDTGNANLLLKLAGGDLRHVHETKQWLRWDGQRWHVDTHESFATQCALQVAAYYMERATRSVTHAEWMHHPDQSQITPQELFDWAEKSRSRNSIANMLDLARKMPGVSITASELDTNPWLLGVDNGVVDLRDGTLREHEAREDFITKRCPVKYDADAQAPRWLQFIDEITGSPLPVEYDEAGHIKPESIGRYTSCPELADYYQRRAGYCSTGTNRDQKFFVDIGKGSNGKNIAAEAIARVLGPYAQPVPAALFMTSKRDADAEAPNSVLASLDGVRFALASEVKKGQVFNGAAIKNHTGDAEVLARGMRENATRRKMSHKVGMLANLKPPIDHLDQAVKSRLHFMPFRRCWNRPDEPEPDARLPNGDKTLAATLTGTEKKPSGEAEGILAWLVAGAGKYYEHGLGLPNEVRETTLGYVASQDALGQWLATMQRCGAREGTLAAELFAQFATWCAVEDREQDPATQHAFGTALKEKEIDSHKGERGKMWGLRSTLPATLRNVPPPPPKFG
jgi:putative DNA primase/helicase